MTARRAAWELVEIAVRPKLPDGDGEDRVTVTYDDVGMTRCAVVDGATDKSGRDYAGMTGGARAAECVLRCLETLPPDTDPSSALHAVTKWLSLLRQAWGIATDDPLAPSAVAAVFMPHRRQIWRVGDVNVAIGRGSQWVEHRRTRQSTGSWRARELPPYGAASRRANRWMTWQPLIPAAQW